MGPRGDLGRNGASRAPGEDTISSVEVSIPWLPVALNRTIQQHLTLQRAPARWRRLRSTLG